MMYGVLHSEAHVDVWYCSAKEQVLALQYHTSTPLSWPSIHHIKNMLTHKKYLTSFVKNGDVCRFQVVGYPKPITDNQQPKN